MRTAAHTLQEPAPGELDINAIEEELRANLHMKEKQAAAWVAAVKGCFPTSRDDVITANDIMSLSLGEMNAACFEAEMSKGELNNIAICLGSLSSPFKWTLAGARKPTTTHDVDQDSKENRKVPKKKGGSIDQTAAEQLLVALRQAFG